MIFLKLSNGEIQIQKFCAMLFDLTGMQIIFIIFFCVFYHQFLPHQHLGLMFEIVFSLPVQ